MIWLIISLSFLPVETLSWTPPTERTDGTPLSLNEIDGYILYWDGWKLFKVTDIYVMVPAGCYQLTTVDTEGRESEKTEEVCK